MAQNALPASELATSTVEETLLHEAAEWAMRLRYDGVSDTSNPAFQDWLQSSPAHGRAWARAEAVFGAFEQLPTQVGKVALKSLQHSSGRRSLGALAVVLLAAPAGWLAWRHLPWRTWSADVATRTGEQREMALADGSRLVLNTASAVNIVFTAAERRVYLQAGEIMVTTHQDPSPVPRPFYVHTPQGRAQALGTRFTVRRVDGDITRVAVFEDVVEVQSLYGSAQRLRASEQVDMRGGQVDELVAVAPGAGLWERGMLLAREMSLADVIDEMSRYRVGVLRCHPSVARLKVSGAISLRDTDAGLALLERSLPLRIERHTPYWVTVLPK